MKSNQKKAIIIVGICLIICCISLAFVFRHNITQNSAGTPYAQGKRQNSIVQDPDSLLEIPIYIQQRDGRRVFHMGYTVDFNPGWHIPNWVAYELTEEELVGDVPRSQNFQPDPQLSDCTPSTFDYSHSGYDRGHMAPAVNMKWDKQAMDESFYTSNICPQNHNLNSGVWQNLEERVNIWACSHGSIYVVCGPIMGDNPETIGRMRVAVPDAFFKVLLCRMNNEWHAIGFYFRNEAGTRPLRSYCRSVDEIERMTGIDFFPLLEDKIENKIEAIYDLDAWGI